MSPRFLPLVLLALLIPAPLPAAKPDAEPARASASFRFVSFAPVKDVWVQAKPGKFVAVQTPVAFIGAPVRISMSGPVGLFAKTPGESKGDPAVDYTRLTAFGAADAPRQLVVLFGDATGGIMAQAIPDNEARFPFGRVLAINLTGAPLRMSLGDTEFALPAKGAHLCPAAAKVSELGDVAVKITEPAPEGPKVVYSTVWPSGEQLRTMVFLYRDAAGRLMVRTIEDPKSPLLAEAPEESAPKRDSGASRKL